MAHAEQPLRLSGMEVKPDSDVPAAPPAEPTTLEEALAIIRELRAAQAAAQAARDRLFRWSWGLDEPR